MIKKELQDIDDELREIEELLKDWWSSFLFGWKSIIYYIIHINMQENFDNYAEQFKKEPARLN